MFAFVLVKFYLVLVLVICSFLWQLQSSNSAFLDACG